MDDMVAQQIEVIIEQAKRIVSETMRYPQFSVRGNGALSVRGTHQMNPATVDGIVRRGELDEWTRETFALTDAIADHFEDQGIDIEALLLHA